MEATQDQIETIKKLVDSFSLLDDNKTRKEKLTWYNLASGIKNIEITEKIMKDIGAI